MSLSAVLITKNEGHNLADCLETLKFCTEIIVVDSGSTDDTVEVARRFTSKVFQKSWTNFAEQRNYAASLATQPWIFSIDADERVSSALAAELQSLVANPQGHTAFAVPRKTFHFGRWIAHGGWYPNYVTRLFQRDAGRWDGGELHEFWTTAGRQGQLTNALDHYSFRDLADQVARNNRYSSLGAVVLRKQGQSFSFLRLAGKTVSKFFETYFLKKGFLDGLPGFIIAVSAAYSVFLKWAKLWEMERTASHE